MRWRYDDNEEAEETGRWWLIGMGRCAGFELMGEIWDFGLAFLVRVGGWFYGFDGCQSVAKLGLHAFERDSIDGLIWYI